MEVLGLISGLLCVWLLIRENVLTFPIGLIYAVLTVVVVYNEKLYADVFLNIPISCLLLRPKAWISTTSIESVEGCLAATWACSRLGTRIFIACFADTLRRDVSQESVSCEERAPSSSLCPVVCDTDDLRVRHLC